MAVEDQTLTNELLKRIFGNLGAVPGENFGKVGITPEEFAKKQITIQIDGEVNNYTVFVGESKVDSIYQAILANIGTQDEPEFILMIKVPSGSLFGFRLYWGDNSDGAFMIHMHDNWVPVDLLHKLNLTAAVEMMTQEGVVWYPCPEVDELYDQFVNLVDFA